MKIIELLNKIANGEDVPDKIKYRNCIFEKTEGAGISPDYANNDNEFFLEYISNEADSLNEIVEIIEDEEDIDIQSIEEFGIDDNEYIKTKIGSFKTRKMDITFLHKINELVQAVKQLDKKVNSIEQK